MRLCLLLPLCVLAACAGPRGESLGRMGGAPPSLILTTGMLAANGAWLGEATLFEELQGDRLVLNLSGLPEGRHMVELHDRGQCGGPGFADAGPARADVLPALEVDKDGKAELYADLPDPRLRRTAGARLDVDGMAVTIRMTGPEMGVRLGCATFRLSAAPATSRATGNSGATDGD